MRLAATLDPTGQATQLAYNPQGQLSSLTLPAKVGAPGIPVINADMAGTLAPGQRKVTLGYNAAGDISLITDALGQETRLSNDALARPPDRHYRSAGLQQRSAIQRH